MLYTDRIRMNLGEGIYEFTQSRTKDMIKDLNKKIKFLKKHNSFCFYNVKNHFIDEFAKVFFVEIDNKFGKIGRFFRFLNEMKDSKGTDVEYCGYVQSILSDLTKKVHEYHIYAAILHGHRYEKINPRMTNDEFAFIFNRKYKLDLHEFNCFRYSNRNTEIKQYQNLRKHFQRLVDDVLGLGYYNEGMDVYMCDEFACRDLKNKMLGLKFKLLKRKF